MGVEGDFSVKLRSKPLVKALDLDLDQAEVFIEYVSTHGNFRTLKLSGVDNSRALKYSNLACQFQGP